MKVELDASDMPDIKSLTADELALVPFDKVKWCCTVKDCNRFTSIKDFGISPWYHWRRMWINLSLNGFFCNQHFRLFKRKEIPQQDLKSGPGIRHLIYPIKPKL